MVRPLCKFLLVLIFVYRWTCPHCWNYQMTFSATPLGEVSCRLCLTKTDKFKRETEKSLIDVAKGGTGFLTGTI